MRRKDKHFYVAAFAKACTLEAIGSSQPNTSSQVALPLDRGDSVSGFGTIALPPTKRIDRADRQESDLIWRV